jgi:hypothetical protein
MATAFSTKQPMRVGMPASKRESFLPLLCSWFIHAALLFAF